MQSSVSTLFHEQQNKSICGKTSKKIENKYCISCVFLFISISEFVTEEEEEEEEEMDDEEDGNDEGKFLFKICWSMAYERLALIDLIHNVKEHEIILLAA